MGDIKKPKKKYLTSAHPWKREEIEENKLLKKEYGLQRRREILKASSFLKKYKDIAKRLIADNSLQGQKERQQMLTKLQRYGLLPPGAKVDEVLSVTLKDILNRRIQTLLCRKGLARSMKQARQFISHRHVTIGEKEITSPSYLLSLPEEAVLAFKGNSTLADAEHPERVPIVRKAKPVTAPEKSMARAGDRGRRGERRGGQRRQRQGGRAEFPRREQNRSPGGGGRVGGNRA